MNKFLALIVLAPFLAVACTPADEGPTAVSGPTSGQAPPAVEDYLDSILPGFASALGLEEIDPEFYSSEMGRLLVDSLGLGQVDPERYSSLVGKFREGGLEALPEEDLRDLLRVAQAAFLSHAQTLRYVATSRDASPGARASHDGHATVEEVYVPGTLFYEEGASGENLARLLGGIHVKSQSISWFARAIPLWDPEASGEVWNLVDFADDGKEPSLGSGVAGGWMYQGGEWTCVRVDLSTAYEYWMGEEGRPLLFFQFTRGTLLGRNMLNGLAVYLFESEPTYQAEGMRYWLDAETLWLRQYEFEDPNGALITVELEAINDDIRIEPPDVDVECVEEDD